MIIIEGIDNKYKKEIEEDLLKLYISKDDEAMITPNQDDFLCFDLTVDDRIVPLIIKYTHDQLVLDIGSWKTILDDSEFVGVRIE